MGKKERGLSRRQWLLGMGAAGLGSLLLPEGVLGSSPEDAPGEQGQGKRIPTRPFGKTGVEVSMLALGGMFDIPSNQLVLRQALAWGVTYWDTADCYGGGRSEEGIGQFFSKHPSAREEVFLVTKSDERSPDGMSRLLDQSLQRMSTNYIDLYFIHGLSAVDEMEGNTRRWAEQAKAAGKIRWFGFSTHKNMEICLADASKLGWIDGIMFSYNYRIMGDEKMKAAVDACAQAGIGLTAMKTQGDGPGFFKGGSDTDLMAHFVKKGFTDKQARLKAVWENRQIASICSQMPTPAILMSNVAAALDRTGLSAADRSALAAHARLTASSYCAGCARFCESAVQDDLPISTVMRCLMYYRHYGDEALARETFSKVPKRIAGATWDIDFSEAERRCPQRLQIGTLVKEAREIFA